MDSVIRYIVWPAVAGLVFGLVLLLLPAQLPRLAEWIPGLDLYLPQEGIEEESPQLSFADAFSKSAPAVVSINSTSDIALPLNEPFNPFRSVLRYRRDESTSLGSGVIISPDGYIITSYHIIEITDPNVVPDPQGSPLPDILVTLYNGETMEARITIIDLDNDLALLKVDATDLAYLTPAEEGSFEVGDLVLALGNPRNIGQSMTQGIISALLKTESDYVIQTDAAINPGSSGGALIDSDGRLVGINSTIVTESGGYEGISFAVPARVAFNLMEYYMANEPGGYLGVDGRFISKVASSMLLDSNVEGFWVETLSRNGPADSAGIRVNDIIVKIQDIDIISDPAAIMAVQTISRLGPGEVINIKVYREGEYLDFSVELGVGEAIIYGRVNEEPLLDPNPFRDGLIH